MGYGLFQGLNEAYDQYRNRELEIEREEDRETERKALGRERERDEQLYEQQQEAYQYGLSKRPMQEELEELQLKGARRSEAQSQLEYNEFSSDEARAQRAATAKLNLEALKQDKTIRALQISDARMNEKAKKGAEKYRSWKEEFMTTGDIDKLVEEFNNDGDDSNNIAYGGVTGNEKDGWNVTFENGQTQFFEDRNAVGIHLESMADPSFHQTYLLQMESQKASLAAAIEKAAKKTPDTLFKEKKEWEAQSTKITDRLKGTIIKSGIVDFGEDGNKEIAALLGSVMDQVGAASGYKLIAKEVGVRANNILNASTDLKPENVRKRAIEKYESLPEDRHIEINGQKFDDDDPRYEEAINRIMYADITSQIKQFERDVKNSYFSLDEESGEAVLKKQNYGVAQDEGTSIPVPEAPAPAEPARSSAVEAAASEDLVDEKSVVDPKFTGLNTPTQLKHLRKQKQKLEYQQLTKKQARDFAKEHASKLGFNYRGKFTVAIKKKIAKDYRDNFDSLSLKDKEAWLTHFARGLPAPTRKLAQASIDAELSGEKPETLLADK
jgi:hypothetical protein